MKYSKELEKTFEIVVMGLFVLLLVGGCDVLLNQSSCKELSRDKVLLNEREYIRYNTKFTIEFTDEWSHSDGEQYLNKLGFSFEEIWSRTFVVDIGCQKSASHYYTNYGTEEIISLGDSSFVNYVNPVFFYRSSDPRLNSDFRLTNLVGVQFDRHLDFKRIQEIAYAHNLQFRDYEPGASLGRYWLIVPKQACFNAIRMADILGEYEEVLIAEPSFIFTIPPPDD